MYKIGWKTLMLEGYKSKVEIIFYMVLFTNTRIHLDILNKIPYYYILNDLLLL